jgi:thiamine pyrophosphate-dependent acetolactate synthase large subunit-like protein
MTTLTGAAIGQGMPVAVGAAVACPDRKGMGVKATRSSTIAEFKQQFDAPMQTQGPHLMEVML